MSGKKPTRGTMKSQRSCGWRCAALFHSDSPVAVFEKINQRRKCMTLVGDRLSAARDIGTSARMMCIVTLRARLRTKYVIVWFGGLITFSASTLERWWGSPRIAWLFPCGAVRSLSGAGACATVLPPQRSSELCDLTRQYRDIGHDCIDDRKRKDCACGSRQP
jgi:hypothetical protein